MTLNHVTHLYFDGRSEAAKKRIQRLKRERLIRERERRAYQPSILHLSRLAFAELSSRGMLLEYPSLAWNQLEDRAKVSELTLRHEVSRPRTGAYRREPARDGLVAAEVTKLRLLEEE